MITGNCRAQQTILGVTVAAQGHRCLFDIKEFVNNDAKGTAYIFGKQQKYIFLFFSF